MQQLYIVVHHHCHGTDVFPIWSETYPGENEAIEAINKVSTFEPSDVEWFDIAGPFEGGTK